MTFFFAAVAIIAGLYLVNRQRRSRQRRFIERYRFNSAITGRVQKHYPHLTEEQLDQVMEGLREYFYICHQARRRMVAMPSQVVDVAWHEFILFTRPYEQFCHKAFGRFLHHTPTEMMRSPTIAQEGIKRAWRLACARHQINPAEPAALPLLFAIDGLLNIEDGFTYVLDCKDKSSPHYGSGYCAGHISCTSGCSGDSGGPSCGGSSGCGSGCGGGD
ncbi:glycine-rich domain-containing protein [Neptuniibacter halophilus]|uniref:glycine-rich domain-containing protein n=1 Tax=Neptuniibacter halophilus TaxID=651666 RepID=UPI00257286EB|nr:hypothetical protein [Neptuniibacter halophilus]